MEVSWRSWHPPTSPMRLGMHSRSGWAFPDLKMFGFHGSRRIWGHLRLPGLLPLAFVSLVSPGPGMIHSPHMLSFRNFRGRMRVVQGLIRPSYVHNCLVFMTIRAPTSPGCPWSLAGPLLSKSHTPNAISLQVKLESCPRPPGTSSTQEPKKVQLIKEYTYRIT